MTNTKSEPAGIIVPREKQFCPKCGYLIGALAGSVDAICQNCGFKDPCCE